MDYFTQVTALAALAVVVVQQILKLNIVPVYLANKYPVVTNIVLSLIASVVVQYQTAVALVGWLQWIVYVATVSVVAAVTYNMTLRNSDAVQKVSNKTEK
jgi:hypothetical protein